MALKVKELKEKRVAKISEARAYYEQHASEWTDDRDGNYSKMMAEVKAFDKQIAAATQLDALELNTSESLEEKNKLAELERKGEKEVATYLFRDGHGASRTYKPMPAAARGNKQYRESFDRYVSSGEKAMSQDQLAALRSDNDPQGGYLVASEQFAAEFLKTVDDILYIRQFATIHQVRESKSLGIRCRSAKMSSFAYTSELYDVENIADTALKFGKKVLEPQHLTGMIKVSRDLLRLTAGAPETMVRMEMARDAAEVQEQNFLTGDGNKKPLGVFVASDDGINTSRDVNTGSATGITGDGLRSAKYALKAQHRSNARWLVHRDFLAMVSKLKSTDNQYLWMPGLTESDPDRLLGLPVMESEKVPNTFTNGLYCGVLGDWRYYEIGDGMDMEVQRLDEKYATTNQVGFIGRLKNDGLPTLPEAFVRLKCAT